MKGLMQVLAFVAGMMLLMGTSNAQLFQTDLSGLNESPPNASPATGHAIVNLVGDFMSVEVTFDDLIGTTTASHIHCCTVVPGVGNVGVATVLPTFTGFPLGVHDGTYSHTFDMTLASSYNPSFITTHGGTVASAEAALFAGIRGGNSYLNVHSTSFPGGEIRGFLPAVPEPGAFGILGGFVLSGLCFNRRRRR